MLAKDQDTIVALATPPGKGALAIVRLSGNDAITIAQKLTDNPDRFIQKSPKQLFLVKILLEDGQPLDQAQCVYYRKPRSYTGEDAVELYLHGSPFIVAKVTERCCRLGARIANPGEFTLRAFLNGKMDLAQAEAVADLIAASSAAAHRAALSLRQGALSRRIQSLRAKLLQLRSLLELQIDFSDQDLPVVEPSDLTQELEEVCQELKSLAKSYQQGQLIREGAVVVIAGKPNVGKSTLFNALLGEDRAIVHATPGTTRDAVEGYVEWEGLAIKLVDTAGWSDEFQGADEIAVEKARIAAQAADQVIWLKEADDHAEAVIPANIAERTIIALNKGDLLPAGCKEKQAGAIIISALQGTGLAELKAQVLDKLEYNQRSHHETGMLTRQRHSELVEAALVAIQRSQENLATGLREELLAADLRAASQALAEIIGEMTPDEVLHKIFADFCIGK